MTGGRTAARWPRIVVTGVGAVTSIGSGREGFGSALLAGRCGTGPVELFETEGLGSACGGEIRDFDAAAHLRRIDPARTGRAAALAVAATWQALDDARLAPADLPDRLGILIGTTMGETQVEDRMLRAWAKGGVEAVERQDVLQAPAARLAGSVADDLDREAICSVIPTACAAGNYALGLACDDLRAGRLDLALAGGADALSRAAFLGFGRMLALAPDRCRPFDLDRKGILVGEGAGMLVLETLDHAQARGAPVLAELRGWGMSCDASHTTIPAADGVASVIERALGDAAVDAADVDLVCAHGTGTRMNDKTEYEGLRRVFGEHADHVPVTSIKSMLGHTMGAASALEAIACVLAIQGDAIPPTIHFETPDPECPVACVANEALYRPVRIALNNAFAFGGNNAATVFANP